MPTNRPQRLTLPPCDLKIKRNDTSDERDFVFDIVRRRWVTLTPEESVRQHFVHYLINYLNTPATHISIEQRFLFSNGKAQRADIVTFNSNGQPHLLIECKATTINITEEVFTQATRYNAYIKAKYIVVTNGIKHYCAMTEDFINYQLIDNIPKWR